MPDWPRLSRGAAPFGNKPRGSLPRASAQLFACPWPAVSEQVDLLSPSSCCGHRPPLPALNPCPQPSPAQGHGDVDRPRWILASAHCSVTGGSSFSLSGPQFPSLKVNQGTRVVGMMGTCANHTVPATLLVLCEMLAFSFITFI